MRARTHTHTHTHTLTHAHTHSYETLLQIINVITKEENHYVNGGTFLGLDRAFEYYLGLYL